MGKQIVFSNSCQGNFVSMATRQVTHISAIKRPRGGKFLRIFCICSSVMIDQSTIQYLQFKIHRSSCVSFLAHRIVSCLGNLICNSPKDNLIGVSFTKNDQRPYSNSLGCYYFSRFVVWMTVFVLISCAT